MFLLQQSQGSVRAQLELARKQLSDARMKATERNLGAPSSPGPAPSLAGHSSPGFRSQGVRGVTGVPGGAVGQNQNMSPNAGSDRGYFGPASGRPSNASQLSQYNPAQQYSAGETLQRSRYTAEDSDVEASADCSAKQLQQQLAAASQQHAADQVRRAGINACMPPDNMQPSAHQMP